MKLKEHDAHLEFYEKYGYVNEFNVVIIRNN